MQHREERGQGKTADKLKIMNSHLFPVSCRFAGAKQAGRMDGASKINPAACGFPRASECVAVLCT